MNQIVRGGQGELIDHSKHKNGIYDYDGKRTAAYGSVLRQGRASSIVEVGRFRLQHFKVSIKELAEWFGLEIARIAVDECLPDRSS